MPHVAGSPMPVLTLAETLAVASPERGRLVEADEAIRAVAAAIEESARRDGLDRGLVSRALVDVMIAAAVRQAVAAYPSIPRDELADEFGALVAEAFEWASRRGAAPTRHKSG
jgi:hypothetical protein